MGVGRGRAAGAAGAFGARIVAGGIATAVMDAGLAAAAILGGTALSADRLSVGVIGRWAGGILQGRWWHDDITREAPRPGETILGALTHDGTGTGLTLVFLAIPRHGRRPGMGEATVYGIATSALPLLVMFPALGYGYFGLRSGEAARLLRIMLVGHTAFGVGVGLATRVCVRG